MPPVQTAQFNREDVTIHLMDIHIDLSNRLEESGPTFIKAALLRHIWQRYDKFPQHKIVITSIGKKSLVHHTVLQAKRGRRRIDKVIRKQEMSEVL